MGGFCLGWEVRERGRGRGVCVFGKDGRKEYRKEGKKEAKEESTAYLSPYPDPS